MEQKERRTDRLKCIGLMHNAAHRLCIFSIEDRDCATVFICPIAMAQHGTDYKITYANLSVNTPAAAILIRF